LKVSTISAKAERANSPKRALMLFQSACSKLCATPRMPRLA
jgi:hypothetical protein